MEKESLPGNFYWMIFFSDRSFIAVKTHKSLDLVEDFANLWG